MTIPYRPWSRGRQKLWWWQKPSKCHQHAQRASGKWSRIGTRPLSVNTDNEGHVNLKPLWACIRGTSLILPEWISWNSSNICWKACWTLNARMVLRPWRVDERWEKTGLRAESNHTGNIFNGHLHLWHRIISHSWIARVQVRWLFLS